MKRFLLYTVGVFILLTVVSTQIHTTDYVQLYGYPKWFLKYRGTDSTINECQSYILRPLNLLIDLGCAALLGGFAWWISMFIQKRI
ncbi:hypothetical protein [Desertivirga xinjiangensis]|uniref:hypothetical protein n=1 Tax=Desertivirga xinjiangensis TaxID=539206 RepID=UPI00210B589E|nr:hypothetical protein [Pedobacter xinjiangensis]